MDPVLSGSLCFLVLVILMYIKFIREHSPGEEEDVGKVFRGRKKGLIEPETVPFIEPAVSIHSPPLSSDTCGRKGSDISELVRVRRHTDTLEPRHPMRRRLLHNYVHKAPQAFYQDHDETAICIRSSDSGPKKEDIEQVAPQIVQQDVCESHLVSNEIPLMPLTMDKKPEAFTENDKDLKKQLISKVVNERPFYRNAVPPPAQMQLEVALKARIPLFLHSPMYIRAQAGLIGEQSHDWLHVKPAKRDRLPSVCQTNSLHIDLSEIGIGDMIGQGAFGTVHRAIWRGTVVAVKVLVCQHLTADILEEFETEVQIMSILRYFVLHFSAVPLNDGNLLRGYRHPHICLLLGACLKPPTRCLIIEYLPKGSLWNVLREPDAIDDMKQMSFARDTALGMNYLHSFEPPILHRDLKSPNLLVDAAFSIKISDFGLARVRAHFQTMTGNCGTTQWMAPEILAAEKYTEKADVFSYGIVCWEIITRACPYDGLCQIQAALGVLNNSLRPTIPHHCPSLFKHLMTSCWDTVPEKRPTFAQILEILHGSLNA